MKKINLTLFLTTLLLISQFFSFSIPLSLAQTDDLSPTPEPTEASEKVDQIREAVKEKVKEKIDQIKQGQKRAFVGKVLEVNETSLSLNTKNGEKQVNVTGETNILGVDRKEISLEDIEAGQFAIAMGYLDENETLEAKRIILTEKPTPPNREAAVGRVTDISQEEKVFTIKNEKKNLVYMIEATSKTTITKKIDGEIEKVKFEDIEENDYLVAIGTPGENSEKIITAKLIHVIPGKKIGQEKKTTPTPSPTSTTAPETEE